jgi:D-alanine-D-alanine ligase
MKIAVLWNSSRHQVLARLGQPCPEKYGRRAVENVMSGLQGGGHDVVMLEADATLLENLADFFGLEGEQWPDDGMVFNMVYGIQGECRYTHAPAMLEMAGVPYTGSSPLGHALALDKVITKELIHAAGVPTPRWIVATRPDAEPKGLRFPLIVKPRHESTSFGLRLVRDRRELEDAVRVVLTQFDQDALVEEYIDGREACIALLGNDPVECLPTVELSFAGRDLRAFTHDDKMHKTLNEPTRVCPADLPEEFNARLREIAVATFRACHCKDYSRVDIRIDSTGNPYVLEINSMAALGESASFVMAAKTAGYTFSSLVCRIVDVAHQRYIGAHFARLAARLAGRRSAASQPSTETEPSGTRTGADLRLTEEFAA